MAKTPSPPRLDPAKWWDHNVFREIFLADVHGEEEVTAIREFGKVFNMMAHEVIAPGWQGTYAEATAHHLRAALADLHHLQGYFRHFAIDEEESLTPRDRRWREFGVRMSEQVAGLADQLEEELRAGLATPDD